MSLTGASFKADAIDHLAEPPPPTTAERRGLTFALVAAAALHLVIPLAIVVISAFAPRPNPPLQEIPVEVVVEKPPPQPPEDKPKPPPQPDDERPAHDAPSAATQEKANRESPDTKTSAPAAPKPEKAETAGAPKESKAPAAARDEKAEAAPTPQQTPPADKADERAAPTPAAEEAEASPPAPPLPAQKPAPPPAPPRKAPPGAPLPDAEALPDYKFAHAATESPIVGGNADTRYFTIVYGMIRAHLHEPRNASPPTRGGAIVFALDETGNLLERRIVSSSGSPNLDMAMMNAIAEAAPYPAPPGWQPRALRLTYGR
jgi:TonB family protein